MKMLELVLDGMIVSLLWGTLYLVGGTDQVIKGMVEVMPTGFEYVILKYSVTITLYVTPSIYLLMKLVKR